MEKARKSFIRELIGEIEIKTLLVSLFFVIAIFIFAYLAHEVVGRNETSFDSKAFNFFATFNDPRFITVNRFFTFFGSTYFIFPAYIILIIILVLIHRRSDAINVAIIAVTSTLLMLAFKV